MESTSPGFAVELGAVAVGGFGDAGEDWAPGFWAFAHNVPRPKQSVKTAAISFFMANNLTPNHLSPQIGR